MQTDTGKTNYPRHRILALAFAVEGGVLLTALLLAGYFDIGLLPLSLDIARDIFIGTAGALPPFAFFMLIMSERAKNVPVTGSLRNIVINEIRDIFSKSSLSDLVLISLLAGFAEELLFRGVLQVKFGIIGASILFGLVHAVSPAYMIVTAVMGLYIGILFQWSGSLLVPVQLHFIYDLCALVYLRYFINNEN